MNDERFLISSWENDLQDIDEEKQPRETVYKEVLWAAEKGNLDKIKELLENNPEVANVVDKDRYTPLHRACYGNHVDMVLYLLSMRANVSNKTQMQWEPLHSCCQWNNKVCAVCVLQAGADVNARSNGGQTPLHIAASHGAQYDCVQLLLLHSYIKADVMNNSGETALEIATRSSKYYRMFDMADPSIRGIFSI